MLKVEITGRMFEVAELLTANNIKFSLTPKDDKWVIAIQPVVERPEWTWHIYESEKFQNCLHVTYANGTFVTDINPEHDPLERLAEAVSYAIFNEEFEFDKDENWLKLFIDYGIIVPRVKTEYQYIRDILRTPNISTLRAGTKFNVMNSDMEGIIEKVSPDYIYVKFPRNNSEGVAFPKSFKWVKGGWKIDSRDIQ